MLYLRVVVRDKDGKLFKDERGNSASHFNIDVHDIGEKAKMAIKAECERVFQFMRTISQSDNVTIDVTVFNKISETYMTLYSYYGSERKFVELK